MLNELYQLASNLQKEGTKAEPVHVDFGEPGLSSNQNLRVILGPPGEVLSVGPLEVSDFLWTLKKGNFKFFPAVRMPAPLIDLAPDDPLRAELKKSTATALLRLLEEKKDDFNVLHFKSELEQARRILKWEHEDQTRLQQLKDFARAFESLMTDSGRFSRSLVDKLARTLRRNLDDRGLKACQALLCGLVKESRNKSPQIETKVQAIFDWMPEGELTGALYSPRMKRMVLECLNAEAPPAEKKEAKQVRPFECALERSPMQPLSGPYPDWSARPVMPKAFKPFSKFSDAACNFRYGKADSEGFPIGEATAKALVAAGTMITAKEQMGRIWRALRNGRFEDRNGKKVEAFDLLIAVPSYRDQNFEAVQIFAPPPTTDDGKEGEGDTDSGDKVTGRPLSRAFRQVAEAYIQSLAKAVDEEDLKSEIVTLLLLRQISPGQVQLAYSATPSRRRLGQCVEEWLKAGSNLPSSLRVLLPSKKEESGIGDFRPGPLYPEQAIRTFSHQWMRNGLESTRVQSPPVGRIFDIFLMKEGVFRDTALELLEVLLPRIEPLLVRAGDEFHRIDRNDPKQRAGFFAESSSLQPDPRYHLAHSLSLLGTLLYYLKPKSEDPMTGTAFTIGKLLAIMDHLHKCYCQVVRDGDIPPTLIGNGLLGRAADSPNEALAELQERGRIYIGWARAVDAEKFSPIQGSKGEASLAAKKKAAREAADLLEMSEPLCDSLEDDPALARPMNAADKAQLFLGYLSSVFPRT